MTKYYGNGQFNLQNAYDDCKSVFENLTEDNFQSADLGLVAYYANEIMYALEKVLKQPKGEWVIDKSNRFGDRLNCSICGARPRRSEYGYDLHDNFCHNCGAKMESKKNV